MTHKKRLNSVSGFNLIFLHNKDISIIRVNNSCFWKIILSQWKTFTNQVSKCHSVALVANCSYLITVPLAPPAVVSMTLVVRLTRKSSWSRPSRSAQYSRVCPDWFFSTQPPETYTQAFKNLPTTTWKKISYFPFYQYPYLIQKYFDF